MVSIHSVTVVTSGVSVGLNISSVFLSLSVVSDFLPLLLTFLNDTLLMLVPSIMEKVFLRNLAFKKSGMVTNWLSEGS